MPVSRMPKAPARRNGLPANTPTRPRLRSKNRVVGLPNTRKGPPSPFVRAGSPSVRRKPSGITAASSCGPCARAAKRRAELAAKAKAARAAQSS